MRHRSGFSLSFVVAILNIFLLAFAVTLAGRYLSVYREQLQEENLGNIASMNSSAAGNATALIGSWDIKLNDVAQYVENREPTYEELLVFINDFNSNEDRQFELIGSDYTGHLARRGDDGAFLPLSYQSNGYSDLWRVFDDVNDEMFKNICFAPEFTDSATALKHFAVYRHVVLKDESGVPAVYTLLLATRSADVLSVLNSQNGFEGQSTVMLDAAGNYIVSNSIYKSTNLFKYLEVYNDLTLDQRTALQQEMATAGSGEFYYKDASAQDCVFRYEKMTTNDWYCVTCVPLSSYRTPVFNISYAIYAVLCLLILLGTDVLWLRYMNKRLRVSMEHEKSASEAKTTFLSRMSHDIRTPLNGIIGLTALAIDEPDSKRVRAYLKDIKVSGNFLLGLVNDVLDMSKVESGKVELHPEPYTSEDLCKYVNAVILPQCADKGLTLRVSSPETDQAVLLDHLRINQIFFNLLSNAVKFTNAGGLVELVWQQSPLPNGRVALDFIVRDNGIGMSEAFQAHMFESFSQEHPATANTGTGLGLSIAWNLVRLMGGEIKVESKQGVGTTFRLHLEALTCQQEQTAREAEPAADSLVGKRVLLCEDNRINTLVAVRLLEKWSMRIDTAENGRIGLERFAASEAGMYDVILMDVMMPELNGMDATRAIRLLTHADAQTIPIIAMTANAYDTDIRDCLNAGMNAHIGKPIDAEKLHALLQRTLAQHKQA